MDKANKWEERIYDFFDNQSIVRLGRMNDGKEHPFFTDAEFYFYSESGILDPRAMAASGIDWPYRPDSYILISAGADGLYGTNDDITNFGN